jgi:hypothetical protein
LNNKITKTVLLLFIFLIITNVIICSDDEPRLQRYCGTTSPQKKVLFIFNLPEKAYYDSGQKPFRFLEKYFRQVGFHVKDVWLTRDQSGYKYQNLYQTPKYINSLKIEILNAIYSDKNSIYYNYLHQKWPNSIPGKEGVKSCILNYFIFVKYKLVVFNYSCGEVQQNCQEQVICDTPCSRKSGVRSRWSATHHAPARDLLNPRKADCHSGCYKRCKFLNK